MGLFDFIGCCNSLRKGGVLQGMCDYHTHILPGLDDGFQTMDQTLEALSYMESLGISEVWCTPHVMDDLPNSTETIKTRFAELCEVYHGPIKLHVAAEYMLDQEFEKRLNEGDLLTLVNDVVLVETSSNIPPYNLLDLLERILSKGYRPMMAHPERYRYMQMGDYRHLHELGVYFQLNLGSVVAYYGETAQKKAWMLLKDGWYNVVGSDCHRMSSIQSQYNRAVLPKKVISNIKNAKGNLVAG